MPSIKATVRKFSTYKVSYVLLKNKAKTLVVGGKIQRTPNNLVNYWDLEGCEVHGEPTEIIGPKGILGKRESSIGYLWDDQGVTVSLERSGPKPEPEPIEIAFDRVEAIEYRRTAVKVPFILIEDNGHSLTWGGEIRMKGQILTDGPGQPAYRIKSGMIEITNLTNGKTAMGYICDEAGVTVDIERDFRVIYPEPFDEKEREEIRARNEKILTGEEVGVKIRFSGAIGELLTFDKLPEIWNIGQSRKNLYTGMAIGAAIMFIVRSMF